MKKRVALIGLGEYAANCHLPAIEKSEKMELVGVMSKDPKDVDEWSTTLHVPGFTNAGEMLDTVHPDFVVIAVYHNQYLPLVEDAAKRGIHVFKEKPVATTVTEAKQLKKIVEESNIRMIFGTQRRFSPAFQKFAAYVAQLKGLYYFEGLGQLGFPEKWETWRADKILAGGGVLMDWGYHLLDIVLWNFGMPEEVTAQLSYKAREDSNYEVEDTVSVLMKFGSFYGTAFISRPLPKREYFRVVGTEQIVEYENFAVRLKDIQGNVIEEETFTTPKVDIVKDMLGYFCEVLDGKQSLQQDVTYHLQHMAFIESCYLSFKEDLFKDPKDLL